VERHAAPQRHQRTSAVVGVAVTAIADPASPPRAACARQRRWQHQTRAININLRALMASPRAREWLERYISAWSFAYAAALRFARQWACLSAAKLRASCGGTLLSNTFARWRRRAMEAGRQHQRAWRGGRFRAALPARATWHWRMWATIREGRGGGAARRICGAHSSPSQLLLPACAPCVAGGARVQLQHAA